MQYSQYYPWEVTQRGSLDVGDELRIKQRNSDFSVTTRFCRGTYSRSNKKAWIATRSVCLPIRDVICMSRGQECNDSDGERFFKS